MIRLIAGAALLLTGFIWIAASDSGTPQDIALAGYVVFFTGLFHCLPRIWDWGEEVGPIRAVLRALWALVSSVTALMGVGLMILAAIDITAIGIPMAILEVFVGGTSLIASADQLHRIWTSRDKQISEKRASSSEQEDASNLILRAAKSHQGRLTAAEIAAATNLHYKVAAKHLEEMAEDGLCEACVGQTGTTFYYFAEFANPNGKRDILEDDVIFDHISEQKEPRQSAAHHEVHAPASQRRGGE
jgi:hypothetical protein